MFVYQNSDRDICVTFKSNRPVLVPEYVISIDHEANTIKVNGQLMEAVSEETDKPASDVTPEAEIPAEDVTTPDDDEASEVE